MCGGVAMATASTSESASAAVNEPHVRNAELARLVRGGLDVAADQRDDVEPRAAQRRDLHPAAEPATHHCDTCHHTPLPV